MGDINKIKLVVELPQNWENGIVNMSDSEIVDFLYGVLRNGVELKIEELEQKSSGDTISRQALLDDFGFSEKTRKYGGDHSGYNTMMLYEIQDVIESQPPI